MEFFGCRCADGVPTYGAMGWSFWGCRGANRVPTYAARGWSFLVAGGSNRVPLSACKGWSFLVAGVPMVSLYPPRGQGLKNAPRGRDGRDERWWAITGV